MKKILFIVAMAAMALVSCSTKEVKTFDFAGTTLKLIEMPGVEYDTTTVARVVELIFGDENRLAGKTGCNLVNGSYYANGDTLNFPQPMAMTRMMCDEMSNNVETAMTNMLAATNRYTVEGDVMSLYNGGELLAKFRIVAQAKCCKHQCAKEGDHKCCKHEGDSCKHEGEHKCMKDSAACQKPCEKHCQKACSAQPTEK